MRFSFYSFLWALPFIAFISGYTLVSFFSYKPIQEVPSVVGRHIQDAIKLLSGRQLNVRILAEKEETDLPDGMVVSQTPLAGQNIKSQQAVYLVVTKRPAKAVAPNFYGMSIAEAQNLAQEDGFVLKAHAIESVNPTNSCVAQDIDSKHEISNGEMAVYVSKGTTPVRIMPSFKGMLLHQVEPFLKNYNISVALKRNGESVNYDSQFDSYTINEQTPIAGSIIDINKLGSVELVI